MGLAMGTRPCIWAAWAGFPDFCHASVSFVYGCPHGYTPEPIELPLGTIEKPRSVWLLVAAATRFLCGFYGFPCGFDGFPCGSGFRV